VNRQLQRERLPMSEADTKQPKRSILALSLGISFTAVTILVAAVLIAGAPTAEAAVYTLSGSCGLCNWSDSTKWSGGAFGTTPGQAAGDTAAVGCLATLSVDTVVANGVILQMNCTSSTVNIPGAPATNQLQIEASSSFGSAGNALTVNGGSLIMNSGAGITNNSGTITLPASLQPILIGALNNAGTILMVGEADLLLVRNGFPQVGVLTNLAAGAKLGCVVLSDADGDMGAAGWRLSSANGGRAESAKNTTIRTSHSGDDR